jgi:GTP cyclohydrolase IA
MPADRIAAARAIEDFLRAIGRDPSSDPALAGTGHRVAAAFVDELCSGYNVDAAAVLRANILSGTTAIVALRDATVETMCPHHLLPASGTGTVAFAPAGKLVGIGVLAEVVDAFARRLILQEEIGENVVRAIHAELGASWVACRLLLRHSCVTARGERKHGAMVETVAFAGDKAHEVGAVAMVRK